MRLRGKTLLILGLTWAGLLLLLVLASRAIVLGGFEAQEEQDTLRHVQRVLGALDREIEDLDRTTYDWASWDDAYRFIEDSNPAFRETNLVDEVFPTLQLNLMLFVHRSGAIVSGQAYDLEADAPRPLPAQLQEPLARGVLLGHQETSSRIAGLLMLPEGPLLVASRPILTSQGQGPIRGTLVFGRYLDAAQVQGLAETTLLALSSHRVEDPQMPPDVRETLATLEEQETAVAARPLERCHHSRVRPGQRP